MNGHSTPAHARLAILLLATTLITLALAMTPTTAANAETPYDQGQPQAGATYAQRLAHATYKRLNEMRREECPVTQRSGCTAEPITYLPRVRRLPVAMRDALSSKSMKAAPDGRHLDADGLLSFWTGSSANAACLDLTNGHVASGPCLSGNRPAPAPGDLEDAYRRIIRSAIWLDRHPSTGMKATRVETVRDIFTVEFPGWVDASYADTDRDGIVDDLTVTVIFEQTGECGEITLPTKTADGSSYIAALSYC